MNSILGDLDFVVVYIDDICIFSETIDDHLKHIGIVLDRFIKFNVKLNPEKCEWFADKIKLLGHIISNEGIGIDPAKVEVIMKRERPKDVASLLSFLGMTNYNRSHIRNYAEIAYPLYNLLKEDTVWKWTDACEEAFQDLRKRLASYPILRLPDPDKAFELHADASDVAMGAVLNQRDEEGK